MKTLVTGAAGMIGAAVVTRLLAAGHDVVGIDSVNDYYDVRLKAARLQQAGIDYLPDAAYGVAQQSRLHSAYRFARMLLEDRDALSDLFECEAFEVVINLAAQAGVRYSLENPYAYIDSNVMGFVNLLECCRRTPVAHLIYASSSSVYGANTHTPFSEDDAVNNPVSLYAATKRSDELLATVYARLYAVPNTGLRFFTVYGPWGRPDMAPMLFADAITQGRPIRVFNNGQMARDFTYVDDIVEGIVRLLPHVPQGAVPAALYNIGHGSPVALMDFIHTLEKHLGHTATYHFEPMQPGDVQTTWADTSKLRALTGYAPQTSLDEGIRRFTAWYLSPQNPLRANTLKP